MNNNDIEILNSNSNNHEKKINSKKSNVKKKKSSLLSISSDISNIQKEKTKKQYSNKDLIQNNFVLLTEISHGSFGKIYLSFNLRDNIEVAIKKELKKKNYHPQLKTEYQIYQSLLHISHNLNTNSYIKKKIALITIIILTFLENFQSFKKKSPEFQFFMESVNYPIHFI